MERPNTKKTKYQQIAEIIEKEGYLSDSQAFKIYGDESGIYKSLEYLRKWKRLQSDKAFFGDKKIIAKRKGYRSHLIQIKGMKEGAWYKVGKEFYDTIKL